MPNFVDQETVSCRVITLTIQDYRYISQLYFFKFMFLDMIFSLTRYPLYHIRKQMKHVHIVLTIMDYIQKSQHFPIPFIPIGNAYAILQRNVSKVARDDYVGPYSFNT